MLDRLHSLLRQILHTSDPIIVPGQWYSLPQGENVDNPLPAEPAKPEAKSTSDEPGVLTFAPLATRELRKLSAPTSPRSPSLNGKKLQMLREALPKEQRTIQFVADCLGVAASTVRRAETQNRGGLSTVIDYSRLFEVPIEELLILDQEPPLEFAVNPPAEHQPEHAVMGA